MEIWGPPSAGWYMTWAEGPFPGMPHGIHKPRENHAVLCQNLAWFSHYLLGEELALE